MFAVVRITRGQNKLAGEIGGKLQYPASWKSVICKLG